MEEDKYDTEETIERAFLRKTVENEKYNTEIIIRMGNKGSRLVITGDYLKGTDKDSQEEFLGKELVRIIDMLSLEVNKESTAREDR